MGVGESLLDAVSDIGARSVAVVGTGKNVGKTVTMRALYEAAVARGIRTGVVSAGRDGEAVDVIERTPKPRLWLVPGTWIASAPRTTRPLEERALPRDTNVVTACGPLVVARIVEADYYELVGPPTSSGMRLAIEALLERCELVLIDGSIDRLATVASGEDCVIVACGAAAAATMQDAVDDVRDVVERLRVPVPDERAPMLRVEGALLADRALELVAAKELRQIVVRSPAAIALSGKAWRQARERLDLRCEQPVRLVAVTIAPESSRRSFDPKAFLEAVAEATWLPAYDVFAGTHVGAGGIATWTR